MDPLEDVLALLETRAHLDGPRGGRRVGRALRAAVRGEVQRGHGGCRLEVAGTEAVELAEGDCFLLTQARPFVLRSAPGVVPVDAEPMFAAAEGGFARVGRGDDVLLVGGRFSSGDRARALLLDALPRSSMCPRGPSTRGPCGGRWNRSGRRCCDGPSPPRSWPSTWPSSCWSTCCACTSRANRTAPPASQAGLADPVVAPALAALHSAPAHGWTVAELARASGVSRSTLAARFKRTVGCPPLDYLRRWRIELASQRLRTGTETLAAIARAVGYGSESALSTAFKEVTGGSCPAYRSAAAA